MSISSPGSSGDQRVVVELVLLDLVAEQAAGQGRGVDGHARELRQDVRQRADVVLVGVRDQERLDLRLAFLEVGDVGDDEVDPEHLLVREHQAAVDHDDLVAVLEDVHVLADLADPAERDDAERLVVDDRGHWSGHGQKSVICGVWSSAVAGGIWRCHVPGTSRPAVATVVGGRRRSATARRHGDSVSTTADRGRRRRRGSRLARPPDAACASMQGHRDRRPCRRSCRPRSPASAARRPGGTSRRPAHPSRPSPDRPAGRCRGACEIRAPGMNAPIECRPSVTITRRVEDLELPAQVRRAGGDLVGLRIAVVGWPALDDVRDEDLLAPPADRGRAA